MASLVLRNLNDLLARSLKARAAKSGHTIEEEGRRIVEAALAEPTAPERHQEAVAKRLNRLLRMLNERRQSYAFTIPKMAAYLKLNTASDLESYFLGEREAPFELLDQIAHGFGVRPDWLKFGQGAEPFHFQVHGVQHYTGGLIRMIENLQPQQIFFVRSLNEEGYATVAFRLDDWKYEGTYDGWNVSKHVGATGQRQLYELWQALKQIEARHDLLHITSGRDLPAHLYLSLVRGEVFPGAVLEDVDSFRSNWFDDFTDVDYQYPIAKNGYAHYGDAFVQAQAQVREHRDHHEKRVPKS